MLLMFSTMAAWAMLNPVLNPPKALVLKATIHTPSNEIEEIIESVPEFAKIKNIRQKKQAFFEYLLPEVILQNELILEDRSFLISIQQKLKNTTPLTTVQKQRLHELSGNYKIKSELGELPLVEQLLLKVDIIPHELVLVQAANESAWGTSRFAQQGFNFFGIWCFRKGCGFVPSRRTDGSSHEVAKFKNLEQAVRRYLQNINSHSAYTDLRAIRAKLRNNMQDVSAESLAEGLINYSERGQGYIDELLDMIRVNKKYMTI